MHDILNDWLLALNDHNTSNITDIPNYYVTDPRELITTSRPVSFKIGTGEHILRDIFPALVTANFEVLIVTCFYAKSPSQAALASALEELSSRACNEQRKVRVRLAFSSISLSQKLSTLFSKSNEDPHEYPPLCWEKLFGLTPSNLSGLDLKISSVFVPPFSVMHPKFVIIDEKLAYLPSCNISWENWFEGCIELRGDIVAKLHQFRLSFWDEPDDQLRVGHKPSSVVSRIQASASSTNSSFGGSTDQRLLRPTTTTDIPNPELLSTSILDLEEIPTVLLPSPHHVNPKFCPFFSAPPPPPTPLNIFLLTVFRKATKSIFIQTPNVTSPPVLSALYEALRQGVDVKIIASTIMMVPEQIVTAGTVTEWSIFCLERRYGKLLKAYEKDIQSSTEEGREKPGQLKVDYYTPKAGSSNPSEPVKSHLKLTIVDDEIVVLGSGNMDRASWYTSQELGMAFFSKKLAYDIKSNVDTTLQGRLRPG